MSILKVKSLFFYRNHEIKLKRFCINIELPVSTSGRNIQSPTQSCRSLQALSLCKRLKSSPKTRDHVTNDYHSLSRIVVPATLDSISVNARFTRFL